MGTAVPKQFLPLAGCPILVHTLRAFWDFDPSMQIVLVLPESELSTWAEIAKEWLLEKESQCLLSTAGGVTRCESVSNGLQALHERVESSEATWVAVHDGVRPFASSEMLEASFSQAREKHSAIACVPVKSSLRIKKSSRETQAVDRSLFFEVQTPQTFRLDLLFQAYQDRLNNSFTDDASLFEAQGNPIHLCEGSYDNIKITTPEDLELGELILKRRAPNKPKKRNDLVE